MKVELKNQDVDVVLDIIFWKVPPNERRKVNSKEMIDTYCQVSQIEYAENSTSMIIGMPLLAEAKAKQNPLDKYNKIVGKKVALAKAIADIAFLNPVPTYRGFRVLTTSELNGMKSRRRLMRQHIWCVFHQTFGRWN